MVRPYIWHELPGWGRLYSRFVGDYRRDASWAGEPSRTIRGKLHGYEIDLDLSRWSERATYFLGRFYDLENQLLPTRILRPGDRCFTSSRTRTYPSSRPLETQTHQRPHITANASPLNDRGWSVLQEYGASVNTHTECYFLNEEDPDRRRYHIGQ
jgi:hypothetical protein